MDTSIITPQIHPEAKGGDRYLKFQLDARTPAAISMESIQEVLIVPTERITLMPNMPECVIGLWNRRNHIVWVIDLAQLLGLQPVDANSQHYQIIMLRVGEVRLALIVQEIKAVTRFTQLSIQSPDTSVSILPYLEGCVWHEQEQFLVLNAEAIIHSPILYNN